MKKTGLFFLLMLCVSLTGFSQTAAPADFFAGKWEISAVETPMGDVKFTTELVRKDGKLTGELTNASDPSQPKRPITKVEEKSDKVIIFFDSSQAGEIAIDLNKVNDDSLKGTLYTFEATAKRLK